MKNNNLMFEEPKYGWTFFNINKYKGDNISLSKLPKDIFRVSYIGPLASIMFKVLIDEFSSDTTTQHFTCFDAEGWFWGIGFTAYGVSIMIDSIDEYDGSPLFLVYPLECTEKQLAEDCLKCWNAYKNEWVKWTIFEYGEDELDGIKEDIFKIIFEELETQEKLLKSLLRKRYGGKRNG